MYRFKSEIDQKGYSTIKFNIPVNKDLIPQCKEDSSKNLKNDEKETLISRITQDVLQSLNISGKKVINWDNIQKEDRSFGGILKSFTDSLGSRDIDLVMGEFKKGEGLKKHYHRSPTEEVYYIVEGEIEVTMDNKKITVGKGDFIYVPPDTAHQPINLRDEICRILFILSPPEREPPVIVE
jgi:mannose-6-phosphate isomerase-like protein (cupin superfamily)